MKITLFIVPFIFVNFSFLGQEIKLDSLKDAVNQYRLIEKKTIQEDTTAVNNLLNISVNYLRVNLDSSYYYNVSAIELSKSINWRYGEAESLGLLAEYYLKATNDFVKSIESAKESLEIFKTLFPESKGDLVVARCLDIQAKAYKNIGQFENSLSSFRKSLEIKILLEEKNLQIISYNTIGQLFLAERKSEEALEMFLVGLDIAIAEGEKLKKSILIGNVALCYDWLSDYDNALKYFFQAIEIDTEIENFSGLIRHYGNLASLYRNFGEMNDAKAYYKRGLELAERLNDERGLSNLSSSLGVLYNVLGDYESALAFNFKALEISTKLNDYYAMANIMNSIGIDYQYSGDVFNALYYFNRAYSLNEKYDFPNAKLNIGNIASIFTEHGSYSKALKLQFEFLDICIEQDDQINEASCYGNIGTIYEKQKRYDLALEYQKKSYELSSELGLKILASTSLSAIGNLHLYERNFKKALESYIEANEISKYIGAKYRISVGFSNIGNAYLKLKDYSSASIAIDSALFYAEQISNPNAKRIVNLYSYQCSVNQGDFDQAICSLSEVRKLIEQGIEDNYLSFNEVERENYFVSIEQDLSHYYNFGVTYNERYPEMADTIYNLALRNKGLSLKSSTYIKRAINQSGDSTLINEYNDFVKLKKTIVANQTNDNENDSLAERAAILEQQIINKSGVYSDFTNIKSIDWIQVRNRLKYNEAAIEFVNYNSTSDTTNEIIYAALIVKKNSIHPEVVKLCGEAELQRILGNNQGDNRKFVNEIYGTLKESNKELYNTLWSPLEQSLISVNKIYYSPIGLLHKVSFASISISLNEYLSDNFDLVKQSSTGKAPITDGGQFEKDDNYLLVGGVEYNDTSTINEIWKYLPGTEKETKTIDKFLRSKKINTNYLASKEAKEETIKSVIQNNEIIHFSTHGFFFQDPEKQVLDSKEEVVIEGDVNFRGAKFNDSISTDLSSYAMWNFVNNKNPLMRSGLVLAGGNGIWQSIENRGVDDGVLTAQEVVDLDLNNTKLVVLSACETGLGEIKSNEGVFGLERSFKMAGAKYIIMSLWQVPDDETAEFMELFYKNFVKVKDVKDAFAKTQKTMRKKYDPYYWAAFFLTE
jgi:CHAT domain-containing protein